MQSFTEADRLKALHAAGILDTPPEASFDAFTELASFICHTPMSTITFIDANRQWFKSRIGLADSETPLDISICKHAVAANDALIVNDVSQDDRFSKFSTVTGDPFVRFYAGMPLRNNDGIPLGTLCVFDREPRQLSLEQERALRALAQQASDQLNIRRVADELRSALQQVRMLRELVPMCAWCRRMRDDANFWQQVEQYLEAQAGVGITHGICPECSQKFMNE